VGGTLYVQPVKKHPWMSVRACRCVFRIVVQSSARWYCCIKLRCIFLGNSIPWWCGMHPQNSIVRLQKSNTVRVVCCPRRVPIHKIMWCHNAEGHFFSAWWTESEVTEWMGLVRNRLWAYCPVVFANQCSFTDIRFLLAINTSLILYILQFWTYFCLSLLVIFRPISYE